MIIFFCAYFFSSFFASHRFGNFINISFNLINFFAIWWHLSLDPERWCVIRVKQYQQFLNYRVTRALIRVSFHYGCMYTYPYLIISPCHDPHHSPSSLLKVRSACKISTRGYYKMLIQDYLNPNSQPFVSRSEFSVGISDDKMRRLYLFIIIIMN